MTPRGPTAVAKKKTSRSGSRKKTTRKKTSAKKAAGKKKTARRKKTTPSKKKTSSRKKAAARKKASSKKTTRKKKSVARKSSKKAASKSAPKAPSSGKPKQTKKKTGKKGASEPKPQKGTQIARLPFGAYDKDSMKASQAAAAKLAQAAGLAPLSESAAQAQAEEAPYKKLKKTPLSKKQLEEFRTILLAKRAEICGDVDSMESEALSGGGSGSLSRLPQHMADQGSDTYDQSLALDIAESQRGLLDEIDRALQRIEDNTYGICVVLGKPIDLERLRAKPWAEHCIEAARMMERTSYHG